jgi:GT2 family glycosyltransferase
MCGLAGLVDLNGDPSKRVFQLHFASRSMSNPPQHDSGSNAKLFAPSNSSGEAALGRGRSKDNYHMTETERDVTSVLRFGAKPDESGTCGESFSPGITVCICTYERAADVGRFLDSLALQARHPDAVVIVDASADEETEFALRNRSDLERIARRVSYFRVAGKLKGLTRQRNFALRWVKTDLVAFFDDDIVLDAGCLCLLEQALRAPNHADAVAACCYIRNEAFASLPLIWRIRKALRLYRPEHAGSCHPSGIPIPQKLIVPFEGVRIVDLAPGCAMCWRTAVFASCSFEERMSGYALGEDVEFSLKTRPLGRKLLVGGAQVEHLHAPAGRPSPFQYGFQCAVFGSIIRRRYGSRRLRHRCHYWLWQTVDIGMLLASGLRGVAPVAQALGLLYGFLHCALRGHQSETGRVPPPLKARLSPMASATGK